MLFPPSHGMMRPLRTNSIGEAISGDRPTIWFMRDSNRYGEDEVALQFADKELRSFHG